MNCYNHSMQRKQAALVPRILAALGLFLGAGSLARAADPLVRVSFGDKSAPTTIEGSLVVEAADGGVLLLGRDGRLHTIGRAKSPRLEKLDRPFVRFTSSELARALCDELGPEFEAVQTRHYVIATRGGREYAQWCGDLFERLLAAFLDHWKSAGLPLDEPKWPLPAIIFAGLADFKVYATADAGELARNGPRRPRKSNGGPRRPASTWPPSCMRRRTRSLSTRACIRAWPTIPYG
jgi:hypothetical protein